jgi:hypothetical protein
MPLLHDALRAGLHPFLMCPPQCAPMQGHKTILAKLRHREVRLEAI